MQYQKIIGMQKKSKKIHTYIYIYKSTTPSLFGTLSPTLTGIPRFINSPASRNNIICSKYKKQTVREKRDVAYNNNNNNNIPNHVRFAKLMHLAEKQQKTTTGEYKYIYI